MRRFFLLCVVLLVSGSLAFGYTNVLENGDSQTITNGWDAAGDMIVGDATPSNALVIAVGGSLTNINAFVGASTNALNNTATVSGAGAEWINTGTLQVGAPGNSNNTVSVSGGGTVAASNLVIHAGNDFNLNNDGTLDLAGGFNVSTNGFNWNAGGTLSVGGVFSGLTNLAGGRVLTLDGSNAAWDLANANIRIGGDATEGAALTSANGAVVKAANLYVEGSGTIVNAGSNSWLLVGEGADKAALVDGGVMVASTNGAVLSVDDFAAVNIPETLLIGASNTETGTVSVANGGTIAAGGLDVFDANSAFNLNDGGTLVMTGDFDATSGAGFNWKDGGTLTVNRILTLNEDLAGTDKTLNVDGGSWDRGGDLQIGGAGNTVSILNGGGVTNDAGYVGGSNNTVMVSGTGSGWVNNGTLNIVDSGNSIAVESGGRVVADSLNITDGNDFYLNHDGTLAVTGGFDLSAQTNLNWNAGGNLSVGGLLEGMAVATNLPMADAAYLSGSKVLTLEGGGQWQVGDLNLVVGLNDDLNRLVIAGGGSVDNADGYIGWGASGDYNSVAVASGGAWTNRGGGLYVGKWLDANTNWVDAGVSNRLSVASGGWVFVGEGRTNGLSGGLIVASTNGAELVVGGKGSSVEVEQGLYVGTDAITTGTVSVASGGTISVGELVIATNSTFDLFGTLAVNSDFNTVQDGFIWHDGSSLSVGGELTGIDTLDGTNRSVEIAGGSWSNVLGVTGVGNTISITESGQVHSVSAFIGDSPNDFGNTVLVGGTGSVWTLTGDLSVNPGNSLELATGGLVSVGGSMTASNAAVAGSGTVALGGSASMLSVFGSDSTISAHVLFEGNGGAAAFTDSELMVDGSLSNRFVNFARLSMTNSTLGGSGTVDGFPNINMSGGWISPEGELSIDGIFVADNTTLRVVAGTDSLHAPGALDLSGLLAEVSVSNNVDPSVFNEEILTADGGLTGGFTATNFIEHFLLYDFALTNDLTTVSAVAEAAADGEIGASVAYAGIQGIRAGFNGMQNAAFVRTKQLRRNSVATEQSISREAYLMQTDAAPAGPQGPGDQNTIFGMHFWAQQFSGQGDYDDMGNTEGFVLNNNGTSFGLDKLLGDSLVLGINYTYARSAASSASRDRVDTETYWLGLYGEWFSKSDYYLEGLLALGSSDYDTVRTDVGYVGEGKFGGSDLGGHIEGGKYFHSKHWAAAPYAGLHYLGIKSDAYTETEMTGGNAIEVDEQKVASLESALGVKLRNRFDTQVGRFQTIGYAEWVYDFINDEIGSTLSDGTISVGTARIAPGASLLNAGVGLSWICTDYLEVGLGYDGRFNENYEEHMGSIMLDIRF